MSELGTKALRAQLQIMRDDSDILLSKQEALALLDAADERAHRAARHGREGGRAMKRHRLSLMCFLGWHDWRPSSNLNGPRVHWVSTGYTAWLVCLRCWRCV